jgi:O-antigen/teichoic acid export membrane protein
LSRILIKVFALLFLAVAARYLGTGGFGQWSLVFLLIGFFGLFADFGVDRLTVRDVARDLGSARKYLSNTLVFKSLTLIPVIILLITFVHLVDYPADTIELFLIALPMLIFGVLCSPFSSIIQAHERIYIISTLDMIMGLVVSLTGISLLFLGYGIKSLLIANTLFTVIRLCILIYLTKGILGSIWHPLNLSFIRGLIKSAFPFAALSVLTMIHYKVDYFMISKLIGNEALGLFAAPYKIFENIALLGIAFNTALYPTISALFGESKEKLRRVYEKLQKYFIIFSLLLTIIIFFFAEEIILLLYGDQYYESINVLLILSFGFSLLFFSIPMRLIINNSNLIMKVVPYSLVTTVMNIILNFIIIPRYGIIGAAVVSLFAGGIDVLIRVYFIRRVFHEGYHPLQLLWKPMIGAVLMISILFIFGSLNKYIITVIGSIAYIYSLYKMGVVTKEEYRKIFREPIDNFLSSFTNR